MAARPKMKIPQYRIAVGTDPVYWIEDDGDQLICETCKISSCEHIQKALTDRLDNHVYEFLDVEVPLSLRHGVWVRMQLGDKLPNMEAKPISFHPSAGINNFGYLGLITPGETRSVIRMMIIDWIRSQSGPQTCQSKTHGPHEETRLVKSDQMEKLVNSWSIFTTGACWFCMDWVNNSDSSIPSRPGGFSPVPKAPF